MMRRLWIALVLTTGLAGAAASEEPTPGHRFFTMAVYLDPRGVELASYQLDIQLQNAEIVGIEGGEHAAFTEAPYYDPAALQTNRVVIAAFNISSPLPRHRVRVARLHLRAATETKPATKLVMATDPDGSRITAEADLIPE